MLAREQWREVVWQRLRLWAQQLALLSFNANFSLTSIRVKLEHCKKKETVLVDLKWLDLSVSKRVDGAFNRCKQQRVFIESAINQHAAQLLVAN